MGFLRPLRLAALCAAVLLASPTPAAPADAESTPPTSHIDRLIAAIESVGQAAARALEESKDAIAEAEAELHSFGDSLNAHKDDLAKIGEQMTAQIEAWQRATQQSWAEMQRSLHEALEAWRGWTEQEQLDQGEDAQIPV